MLYVGAGKREAHHVCADDEGQAERLERAGDDEREAERERRYRTWRLEELQEPRYLLRKHHADDRAHEPHAERLDRSRADGAPLDAPRGLARRVGFALGADDAHADREDDDAQDVVDDRAGHDRHALLGVHLLLLGEYARGYADGSRRRHDAHEHRRRRERRLDDLAVLHELAELGEALDAAEDVGEERRRVDGAEIAEHEREHDASYANEGSRERVLEEHLEVRLDSREEQEDYGRDRADAVELRRRREGVPAGQGLRPERVAVEEPVLEHPVEAGDRNPAERPRTYDDSRAELAEHARELERSRDRPADLRGEDDYADLQNEEEHLRRHTELCRPVGRVGGKLPRESAGRAQNHGQEDKCFPFHLLNLSTFQPFNFSAG